MIQSDREFYELKLKYVFSCDRLDADRFLN